jgi:hypothetical protein
MKYTTYLALIGSAASVKIAEMPECEYHKSEDGLSCDKIQSPCVVNYPAPILEKCAPR